MCRDRDDHGFGPKYVASPPPCGGAPLSIIPGHAGLELYLFFAGCALTLNLRSGPSSAIISGACSVQFLLSDLRDTWLKKTRRKCAASTHDPSDALHRHAMF